MPRKVFVAGEILTAADVNANLMDQAVQVFDDATARDAAIPSPTEGMIAYLEDTDALVTYGTAWAPAVNTASLQDASVTTGKIAGSAITEGLIADDAVTLAKLGSDVALGKILQVVSVNKTDVFTTTSATYTDVTGLSVSITPTSSSSKILILPFVTFSQTNNAGAHLRLLRDSTPLAVGDTASNRTSSLFSSTGGFLDVGFGMFVGSPVLLDNPATTSALTYKVQGRRGTTGTLTVNRMGNDADNADHARTVSSITVVEVAG